MSHRALIGLVVVSVALNLLLAGVIGGHVLLGQGKSVQPLAWALREIPPTIREQVRPIILEHSREMATVKRDVRRSERRLRRLIESEALNREDLQQALTEMRESAARYHEVIHAVGLDVLLSLEVDQRIKAAPYLFRPPGVKSAIRRGEGRPRSPRRDAAPKPDVAAPQPQN
jgi:uncharacterized membrane protein